MRLLFIYNAHSGQGRIKNVLSDITDLMVKAGYEVTIYPTQSARDATNKVIEEAAHYDRIVCSGGDGTLDEVVTGVMRSKVRVPIGYIPAGSTNDFGNSLGIAGEMLDAAHIAAGNQIFPCDVGRFNDDYFVYVAAFGAFTRVSYATSQELKNALGHVAYILEGAKSLADIPSYPMQIEYDGHILHGEFVFGMVTNATSVGGFKGIISGDISLNDGVFEVTLVRTPKNPIELTEILGFFTNLNRDTERVETFQAREVRFTARESVAWTLDGEYGGDHETVTVTNLPNAMDILVGDVE